MNFQSLKKYLFELQTSKKLDENLKFASVALILCNEKDPQILFIQRALNPEDPWSGHMAFPGGRQEPHDLSSQMTAERESMEEVGFNPATIGAYLGPLNELQGRHAGQLAPFKIVPHAYWLDHLPPLSHNPREVAQAHWISLKHLLLPENQTTHTFHRGETQHQLPAISFQDQVIWGLSYLILRDFLQRLERTPLMDP